MIEELKTLQEKYFKDTIFSPEIMSRIVELANIFTHKKKLELLGNGATRICFASKDTVYKLPLNEWGFMDNYSEADIFKKWGRTKDIPYAKCRLIHINDIPVLAMERLDMLHHKTWRFHMRNTWWVGHIDCGQIGMNKKGEIFAYDYATSRNNGFICGTHQFKDLLISQINKMAA